MTTPPSRSVWLTHLERLSRPVLQHLASGSLHEQMPREHAGDCQEGRLVTMRLEALGRLLAGIAPWLDAEVDDDEQKLQQEFRDLLYQGLEHALHPGDADYLGTQGHPQAIVDTAFVAQGILRAPQTLCDRLPGHLRDQLGQFLQLQDDLKPYFNNWLLFSACIEAAKRRMGLPWDPMRIDYAIRQHEQWYLGDGHYGDGPHFHADYYNSFVIQPMQLDILEACPEQDELWDRLTPRARERLGRYAVVQERMIHTDGTWPAIGRSICYRAGAFHALSSAAWKGLLPEELPPAQVRCALSAVIQQGFRDSVYDEQGWLKIGLSGSQPALGERYITSGSLYLASFVFPALGLPASDPFWSDADLPWTAIRIWERGENLPNDHALYSAEALI